MADRFMFEEKIMDCWRIVDDVRDLNTQYMNGSMTEDQVANYLLGLETIYQIKFEQLFHMFEKMVQEDQIL